MRRRMSKGHNIVSSFSYPAEFEEVMRELHVIAAREGKEKSQLIREVLLEYVNKHKEGNDTYKLDNFQEDPEFFAVPTILAQKEKWQRYIAECNNEELTKLGVQSGYIRGLVEMRRSKEFRERQSKT
jgi:hypothetical protein